jgi:hypothetical protein
MPIKLMQRYSREDLKTSPEHLFVFGDNCGREGLGGQAGAARGELNAVGICTKKTPSYEESDFFTDQEYTTNVFIILADFAPVFEALKQGRVVVWPLDGIGTGLADLPARAPHTLRFINAVKEALIRIYGVVEFT